MAATAMAGVLIVLGTSGAALAEPQSPPPRSDKSLEEVRKQLDRLYHEAAVATEAYNAAEEKADQQSDTIAKLDRALSEGRQKLDTLKNRVGAAARAQYRGGGLPPEAQLMLSDSPQQFLTGVDRIRQGQHATERMLSELTRTQQALETYAEDAATHGKTLEADRKAKDKAKKKVKERIESARKLESRLAEDERERLRTLERQAASRQQASWLSSGILDELTAKASPDGKKAVIYATAQIGKPYQWGAEGPQSYDCSGLTSQAWAAAGIGIPRTSQEQWRQLPHIAVTDMRPGDLIIYHADASHVGMYIGQGSIVHAPRPGRTVTVAGAGSMQILGVVRPER